MRYPKETRIPNQLLNRPTVYHSTVEITPNLAELSLKSNGGLATLWVTSLAVFSNLIVNSISGSVLPHDATQPIHACFMLMPN